MLRATQRVCESERASEGKHKAAALELPSKQEGFKLFTKKQDSERIPDPPPFPAPEIQTETCFRNLYPRISREAPKPVRQPLGPLFLSFLGGCSCHVCFALPQLPVDFPHSLLKSNTSHFLLCSEMSYILNAVSLSLSFHAYVKSPHTCIKTDFLLLICLC